MHILTTKPSNPPSNRSAVVHAAVSQAARDRRPSRTSPVADDSEAAPVTIAGHSAILKSHDADGVTIHTALRLCPDRQVRMRLGREDPVVATVLTAAIVCLKEPGPLYRVELAARIGSPSPTK